MGGDEAHSLPDRYRCKRPRNGLVADLDEVLIGDLAPFRSGLSTSPVPGDISSDALLLPKQVDAILAWYDAKLGCRTDRRPALSIWMGWHFQAVLPILLAANVLLDRSPDLAFDRVRFALSSDLKATAIVVGPNVEQLTGVDGLETVRTTRTRLFSAADLSRSQSRWNYGACSMEQCRPHF